MFNKETYIQRRASLKAQLGSGLALFLGNPEAAYNYPANTYRFRQDSSFLYFFGLNQPDLAGVIDIDNNRDYIFGNDVDLDDIIWMGDQPLLSDRAALAGVENTAPLAKLPELLKQARSGSRKIHYLPPYRGETYMELETLLNMPFASVRSNASAELIKAVVKLRSVKDKYEIEDIEKAIEITWHMHTTAMKMAMPGVIEQEIAGRIEGIAISMGAQVSFPVILSVDGQTLHNHYHGNTLKKGRMLISDAGAETNLNYCSDITRTVPVGGIFDQRQKDIYEIVLEANMKAIQAVKPGRMNRDVHFVAARVVTEGLKSIGLMKGNTEDALAAGAHAMFFPHGLGHMLGLDVHDLEGLGENHVGYDETVKRSEQFGLAFLRLAKALQPGYVITIEPGIYFIPALINKWKSEGLCKDFINFDKAITYFDFGGIRIEDDILVTESGYRVLGRPIPKTVKEVEEVMGM